MLILAKGLRATAGGRLDAVSTTGDLSIVYAGETADVAGYTNNYQHQVELSGRGGVLLTSARDLMAEGLQVSGSTVQLEAVRDLRLAASANLLRQYDGGSGDMGWTIFP